MKIFWKGENISGGWSGHGRGQHSQEVEAERAGGHPGGGGNKQDWRQIGPLSLVLVNTNTRLLLAGIILSSLMP